MKRSTRLSSCASEIMEKPVISSSPYSTIRRLNIHRETRSIWAILVHVKPDDLRCRRTSSDIKYLGRPTLPDRKTSELFKENTARFVQFESCRIPLSMQKTYISQYFIQFSAIDTDERQILLESYHEILEPYLDVLSHSYFRSVPFRNTCVWGLWSTTKLGLPLNFVCHLRSEKSGSWDLMMRKGSAQKMLNEYCTVLNEYLDRECERI